MKNEECQHLSHDVEGSSLELDGFSIFLTHTFYPQCIVQMQHHHISSFLLLPTLQKCLTHMGLQHMGF